MKIEQVKQVIEIARMGSINKAAQNLYMAQSSLSASVKSLERELSKEIFIRSSHKIEPTEFGLQFIEEGRKLLKHYQIILDLAGKERIISEEQFSISVYYLLFASRAFSMLCNRYKNLSINFGYWERSRMEIISDVAENVSELGILVMPSIRSEQWKSLIAAYGLEYHKLSDESPFLLFGKESCLYNSGLKEIHKDFIKSHRMIIIEDENELFRSINRETIRMFQPGSCLSLCDRGTISTILQYQEIYYVATTNAYAYSGNNFYAGLQSLPITGAGDFHFEIGYVKTRGAPNSALAEEYLSLLRSFMSGG